MEDVEQRRVTLVKADGHWTLICVRRDDAKYVVLRVCDEDSGPLVTFTNMEGIDVFSSRGEALRKVAKDSPASDAWLSCLSSAGAVDIIAEGVTLAGGVRRHGVVYLLLVDGVETAIIFPPMGTTPAHVVWRVMSSKVVTLPLTSATPDDVVREDLESLTLGVGHHYYSTCDLGLGFPHCLVQGPSEGGSTDWNLAWRMGFQVTGLEGLCCRLYRGVAVQGPVCLYVPQGEVPPGGTGTTVATTRVHFAMLARCCSKNPRPRYMGRGLFPPDVEDPRLVGPGNEYHCEAFCWTDPSIIIPHSSWRFSRHTWYRGTVPLHFTSDLQSYLTDALITMDAGHDRHTEVYFQELLEKMQSIVDGDSPGPPPTLQVVDLLRRHGPHFGEPELSAAYEQTISSLPDDWRLRYISFDWHHSMSNHGVNITSEALWDTLGIRDMVDPVTVGNVSHTGVVTCTATQREFIRYNCADSLDRTNLSTCFTFLALLPRMYQGIGISSPPQPTRTPSSPCWSSDILTCPGRNSTPLGEPSGREEAGTSVVTLPGVLFSVGPTTMRNVVEMFVANGDTIAGIFTGSSALHTAVLRDLAPGMPSATSNAVISINRRYQNVYRDADRSRCSELLLNPTRGKMVDA